MPVIFYRRSPRGAWLEWANRIGSARDVRASADDLLAELAETDRRPAVRIGERGKPLTRRRKRESHREHRGHRADPGTQCLSASAPQSQGLLF